MPKDDVLEEAKKVIRVVKLPDGRIAAQLASLGAFEGTEAEVLSAIEDGKQLFAALMDYACSLVKNPPPAPLCSIDGCGAVAEVTEFWLAKRGPLYCGPHQKNLH